MTPEQRRQFVLDHRTAIFADAEESFGHLEAVLASASRQ
jgi:hypothetical protein